MKTLYFYFGVCTLLLASTILSYSQTTLESIGFESGIGAWTQSASDDFDWTVRSGSTPSGSTGPSGAQEGSNYIYLETSGPATGDQAIVTSPGIDLTAAYDADIDFYYHMYGSSMGTLYLQVNTGSGWSTIWSQSGNQGTSWISQNVSLTPYVGNTIQLQFIGERGTSYTSDMALDNIVITGSNGGSMSLTSCNDTFNDGSDAGDYAVDATWTYSIGAECAASVTINFTISGIADANDVIKVYDGTDATGTLVATYAGSWDISPPFTTSNGGDVYVTFETDGSGVGAGWSASYTCAGQPTNGTGAATTGPAGITSNLALWLRADQQVYENRSGDQKGNDAAESGDAVDSWGDYSGARTNDATTAGGLTAPTYYNDTAYNINFNPVLNFDNTDGLDFGDDYLFAENNGLEMLVVARPDAGTTSNTDFVVDFGNYPDYGFGLAYSSEDIRVYAADAVSGVNEAMNGGAGNVPAIAWAELDYGTTSYTYVNGGQYKDFFSCGALSQLGCNDIAFSPTHDASAGPLTIGRQTKTDNLVSGSRTFKGSVTEVIIFDADKSDADINKVETYLALKYGITLEYWFSPPGAGDYVSSSGTTIWDYSAHTSYQYNIAGIGRDDASDLYQKQSQSSSSGSVVSIGLKEVALTNDANTNTFSSDESFMIWGSRDWTTNFASTFNSIANSRMTRKWVIEETGSVDTVMVRISNDITPMLSDEDMYLVVSSDDDMQITDSLIVMSDNGTHFTCLYDFSDGEYFTFTKGAYTVYCSSGNTLTASNGAVDDGSGSNSYGNDSNCDWQISVSGADSITLDFGSFVTYDANDYVKVYDGTDNTGTLLGTYSGDLTGSEPTVTNSSGDMFIEFITDGSNRAAGWSADYYAWFISGRTDITSNSGSLSDGSGSEDYGNRTEASWLIDPSCAGPIIIDFTAFVTDDAGDTLNIYDGVDDTGRLLGSYHGDLTASLPQDTATSGNMYVSWNTDDSGSAAGWSADYTSSVLAEGTGAAAAGPAGITSELALWLKADSEVYEDRSGSSKGTDDAESGDAIQSWADVSGARTNDATVVNGLGSPVWYDDPDYNINFNPVLSFDGTDDGLDFYDDYLFLSNSGLEMIAVVAPDASSSGTGKFVIDNGAYSSNGHGLSYSGDYLHFYGDDGGNGGEVSYNHSESTYPVLLRGELDFASDSYLFHNGENVGSMVTNSLTGLDCGELQLSPTHEINAGPLTIGRQSQIEGLSANSRFFKGRIAEIIVYNRDIPLGSVEEERKIRTYLSLKYGITPYHQISAQHDFYSSSYTSIFSAPWYPAYFNDVAGIGRDDASGLNQKQSKSVNTGSVLTIGLGDIAATNNANANIFTADESFLIWGRKESTTTNFETTFEGNVNSRMNRCWKIEETGTVGNVKLRIPNTVATLQSDEMLYLVVSSDETYTLASDDTVQLTDDGTYFTAIYDFSGARNFFTFFKASYETHCSGGSSETASNGIIEDGSGLGLDYGHNSDCNWLISVSGAESITVDFKRFITYDSNDSVSLYDGSDETATLLGTYSGDLTGSLPSVTSSGSDLYIVFKTDGTNREEGWSLNYYATFVSGDTPLSTESATIEDGSGFGVDYGNNTSASWTINVPCAWSITLDFTRFVTDSGADTVNVYDGTDDSAPLLGSFSGDLTASLPSVSTTGEDMHITWTTDGSGAADGWSAEYTSDIPLNGTGAASVGPGGVTSSLALWLKADAQVYSDRSGYLKGATAAGNGESVNSWGDYSGARTYDPTTANGLGAPTWYDSSAFNINFNPVLHFDGTDDGLDIYDDWLFAEGDGMEIIAVLKPDDNMRDSLRFVVDFGNYPNAGYGMAYSSEYTRLYGATDGGGFNQTVLHTYETWPGDPLAPDGYQPAMIRCEYDFGSDSHVYRNGSGTLLNSADQFTCEEIDIYPTHEASRGPLTIGRQSKNTDLADRLFNGEIAELIIYDKDLTDEEEKKVQTYLTIKFGIPLHGLAGDLLDSDGTIIWDAGFNWSHHEGISGIGRDDASGLYQKQSRVNAGQSILAIGLGEIAETNNANTSTISADKSYMIWGHTANQSPHWSSTFDGVANSKNARNYLVEEVGTIGTVEVGMDISAMPTFNGCEQLYLIVDTDFSGNFTTSDSMIVMIQDGDYYTCLYDFQDEDLFSFVKYDDNVYIQLPGANTVVTAEEHCERSATEYTYFYDVNDPEKLRFAIDKFPEGDGANTSEFDASVTIITRGDPTQPDGVVAKTDELSETGTFYSGRFWNVDLVSGSLDGWVNIRFFFDALDTAMARNEADEFNDSNGGTLPMSSLYWFKSLNESFDTTKLGVLGYEGNKIYLNNYEYGTEDGTVYVEFKEVSSFSGGGALFGVNNGTLPVTLLDFAAVQNGSQVQLSWSTADEENTEKFVVQRSADLQNWVPVGEVTAHGFSQVKRDYGYADRSPRLGMNYYRLKIIDFDGYTEYSENRFVRYDPVEMNVQLYPNPARDVFHVVVSTEDVWFELFNAIGKMETIELEKRDGKYTFNTHHLAKGMYFLQVHTPQNDETIKVIVE